MTIPDHPVKPFGAAPAPRQVRWHELETFSIVHFGINTFTNKEWGFGDESPQLFDPSALDADQWAETCVQAGLKGLILVCKHHDGFCLWPTKTTEHSVRNSPWRQGKGDVVREVADACRRHGLKFGTYLSPWDRNHAEYGRPDYVKAYHAQLLELLTGYGPLFEVWFDGANGGDGYYGGTRERRSIDPGRYYEWDVIEKMVRRHQPDACMFGVADIRSGGNELGFVNETCWATFPNCGMDNPERFDHATGVRDGEIWMPAEAPFPLRKGWFFHEHEDIRQPIKLMELYFKSVGRGSAMNIGLAPDRRGLIHEDDIKSLKGWNELRRETFAKDLLKSRKFTAKSEGDDAEPGHAAAVVGDRNGDTYWYPKNVTGTPEIVLEFEETVSFNLVELQEFIPLGQRIEAFAIDAWMAGAWQEIGTGTSIGSKRLLLTQHAETTRVRIRITQAAATPALAGVGLYQAPLKLLLAGDLRISRDTEGLVTLSCTNDGLSIRYTLDGSAPDSSSPIYRKPFPLKNGGTIRAYAFIRTEGEPQTSAISQVFGCDRSKWTVASVSLNSPFSNGGHADVTKLLNDDPSTYWHTYHQDKSKSAPPHQVTFDMGELLDVRGFTFMPFGGEPDGTPDQYEFHLSLDGVAWQLAAAGEFPNIKVTPGMRAVHLDRPVKARFLRFVATHVIDDGDYVLVSGLGAITAA